MRRYNQFEGIKKVSDILAKNGFNPARVNKPNVEADIIISNQDEKKVNILVRHLEKDHAYSKSPLPYKIYKVEAFDTDEDRNIGLKILDFVIGYNFNDESYACIPIQEYKDKRSVVIHEKEGTRHEFYNSLLALEDSLNSN